MSTVCLNQEDSPIPSYLDLIYLSIVERRFYSVEHILSKDELALLISRSNDDGPLYQYCVVGMAPYGGVAVWVWGPNKASLFEWIHGEETYVDMADFMPMNPTVTMDSNCDFYINNDKAVKENLESNGLPSRSLFDKYMQQYAYRYSILFEQWNNDEQKWGAYDEAELVPELDGLEEALYDGTHDKLNDGGRMKYHEAGKPKKLALKWHVENNQSAAYFWFHDEGIKLFFERFYGPHPDTKSDFIIRIDPDKNKYQISMYRYGLKEPVVMPEDTYELIVFRNKFEAYRSDNYNQPSGAWLW